MGYTLSKTAPSTSDPTARNRVWDFLANPQNRVPKIAANPCNRVGKTAHAPTKPASGIPYWLSRDPIAERGGVNLNAFVGNDGVNQWDVLGLEGDSDTECCDEETIAEGEEKLNEVYKTTKQEWEDAGRPHKGVDDDSCFAVNSEILIEFTPIPKCWECKFENGKTDPQGGFMGIGRKSYDHWIVVCEATDEDGNRAGKISFDYWADRPAGEDPDDWFRTRYKNEGDPDFNPAQGHIVCRQNKNGGRKIVFK